MDLQRFANKKSCSPNRATTRQSSYSAPGLSFGRSLPLAPVLFRLRPGCSPARRSPPPTPQASCPARAAARPLCFRPRSTSVRLMEIAFPSAQRSFFDHHLAGLGKVSNASLTACGCGVKETVREWNNLWFSYFCFRYFTYHHISWVCNLFCCANCHRYSCCNCLYPLCKKTASSTRHSPKCIVRLISTRSGHNTGFYAIEAQSGNYQRYHRLNPCPCKRGTYRTNHLAHHPRAIGPQQSNCNCHRTFLSKRYCHPVAALMSKN